MESNHYDSETEMDTTEDEEDDRLIKVKRSQSSTSGTLASGRPLTVLFFIIKVNYFCDI